MIKKLLITTFTFTLAFILIGDLYAQGRGRGGGRPVGVGGGNSGGMGGGRSHGAWERPGGRTVPGRVDKNSPTADRRAHALRNAPDNNELNRYRGISKKLGTTPETLRAQYIAASTLDPDLKFGQFVAANVVASNLNRRYSGVTSAAILARMRDGDSLGQALKNLRVDAATARRAKTEAKQQIKGSMHRN